MEELVDDEGDAAADIAATAADAAGPDVEDTSANLDQEPFAEMYSNSQQQEGTIQGAGQQRSPVRQAVIQAQVSNDLSYLVGVYYGPCTEGSTMPSFQAFPTRHGRDSSLPAHLPQGRFEDGWPTA